jgi:hypothetical protein
MRILLAVVVLALAPLAAQAQTMPPGAAQREAALASKLTPRARAFVDSQARAQSQMKAPSIPSAQATALAALGPNYDGMDINDLVMLVMARVNRDAEADLRQQMAQMKAANKAKQAQREKVHDSKAAIADARTGGARSMPTVVAGLKLVPCKVCETPDGLGDMSEMDQLRLQALMDRRQQAFESLSSLMKKFGETRGSIIKNQK